MAKVVDPAQLTKGVELVISTAAHTVQLVATGNLTASSPGADSGATMQALYSKLKLLWKTDNDYNPFLFPLKSFTKNEFLWINGWAPADADTRTLLRDAGWKESVAPNADDLYAGMISLGSFDAVADQGYYARVDGFDQTTLNFDKSGNVNEAILIDDASVAAEAGDFTGYFKAFLREEGKLYSSYDLLFEQGIAALEPTLYRFPLSNAPDINAIYNDATVDAAVAPYNAMDITYYAGIGFTTYANGFTYPDNSVVYDPVTLSWWYVATGGLSDNVLRSADTGNTWVAFEGQRDIGGVNYPFTVAVDAGTGTLKEVYSWSQRQLRKTTDINTGAGTNVLGVINGNVAEELSNFVGSDIVMEQGVALDNYAPTAINNIVLVPEPLDGAAPAEVRYPFEVVVTLNMPANVVAEANADTRGVAYFTHCDTFPNAGSDFDTASAIIVQDNTPANIDFDGAAIDAGVPNAFVFSYDYTANTQRGAGSGGQPVPVTLQLCGLAGFEIGTTEFEISAVSNLTVNIVATDERNYIA